MRNEAKCHQAIDKAMQLFWEKGYAGTSMRDLQVALDMRPGSIYASLGDKDAIFLRAICHYKAQNQQRLEAIFASSKSAVEGLVEGINQLIFPEGAIPSQHCFMVKTVAELESRSPKLVAAAQAGLGDMRNVLAKQIAQLLHVAPDAKQANELAGMIQAQIIGLKTMLTLGRTLAEVQQDLCFMLRTILPQTAEYLKTNSRELAAHSAHTPH